MVPSVQNPSLIFLLGCPYPPLNQITPHLFFSNLVYPAPSPSRISLRSVAIEQKQSCGEREILSPVVTQFFGRRKDGVTQMQGSASTPRYCHSCLSSCLPSGTVYSMTLKHERLKRVFVSLCWAQEWSEMHRCIFFRCGCRGSREDACRAKYCFL